VVRKVGRVDVSFNLVPIRHIKGTALVELSLEDFTQPLTAFTGTHSITATTAARHMSKAGSGVILMMTTTPARLAVPRVGPFGAMCAAIEGFSKKLAAEVGARGVRVGCLLSTGSPETSGVQGVFELHAKAAGTTAL
jgi:3-oxoacyl-[acyl-carrier protein] reductase